MSIAYRISITVSLLNKKEVKKVKDCLSLFWDWQSETKYNQNNKAHKVNLYLSGEGSLSFWDEEQFARKLRDEVWGKLRRYVPITVSNVCLEYLPTTEHEFDKEEYIEWKKQ